MKNTKIIIIVIAVLFISVSSFVISRDGGTTEDVITNTNNSEYTQLEFSENNLDTSDWLTYRNEEFGFEVKYPEGVIVSSKQASDMKEMYEFGFYLEGNLGKVSIAVPEEKIHINIYVYEKDVDTLFKMYSDLNKSRFDTVKTIPLNNTNLSFLDRDGENDDLFRYQREYFAGDQNHAYEITPTQIPEEYKKMFEQILLSFKLVK